VAQQSRRPRGRLKRIARLSLRCFQGISPYNAAVILIHRDLSAKSGPFNRRAASSFGNRDGLCQAHPIAFVGPRPCQAASIPSIFSSDALADAFSIAHRLEFVRRLLALPLAGLFRKLLTKEDVAIGRNIDGLGPGLSNWASVRQLDALVVENDHGLAPHLLERLSLSATYRHGSDENYGNELGTLHLTILRSAPVPASLRG
jgi:hypothetical protein